MVEVRLMRRVGDSTYYLEVLVQSRVKPHLKLKGIRELPTTAQAVGLLGGALAEELCERYRDTLEPSDVALAAGQAYMELMADTPQAAWGDEAPREADKYIAARLAGKR